MQVASATYAIFGYLVITAGLHHQLSYELAVEAVLLLSCNLLSATTARSFHLLRRRQYLDLLAAQRATKQLAEQRNELRLLAENLRRAHRETTMASHAKSEFLAHMSHELRTPLNAIIGFSEMMVMQIFGSLSAKYQDYVSDIHSSALFLLSVINNVLDLAKIEAGKQDLVEERLEIGDIAETCQSLVRERAKGEGVKLINALAADGPAVYGDRRMVTQILLNLLTNAVKFTPSGGTVTIDSARQADGRLALIVEDTGVGIAESDLSRITEPYQQAEHARRKSQEGTGLGLPLAGAMIELHGGQLQIESALGVGTKVTVLFPSERVIEGAAMGRSAAAPETVIA